MITIRTSQITTDEVQTLYNMFTSELNNLCNKSNQADKIETGEAYCENCSLKHLCNNLQYNVRYLARELTKRGAM